MIRPSGAGAARGGLLVADTRYADAAADVLSAAIRLYVARRPWRASVRPRSRLENSQRLLEALSAIDQSVAGLLEMHRHQPALEGAE